MGIIWKYHMKMCHRGWWQNHTSAHYTSYAQCEHLTRPHLTRCSCRVKTMWRKGTRKWANVVRACECVYECVRSNIKNALFGHYHQLKKPNKRQFIVCHAKYNFASALAKMQHSHVLRVIMWFGPAFYFCHCWRWCHSLCRTTYIRRAAHAFK